MVNFADVGTLNSTMLWTVIVGLISFALTIYTVYLNWKQAKVNAQMGELIASVKNIEGIMVNHFVAKRK